MGRRVGKNKNNDTGYEIYKRVVREVNKPYYRKPSDYYPLRDIYFSHVIAQTEKCFFDIAKWIYLRQDV